jgi:hypothetical protein
MNIMSLYEHSVNIYNYILLYLEMTSLTIEFQINLERLSIFKVPDKPRTHNCCLFSCELTFLWHFYGTLYPLTRFHEIN